MRMRDLMIVIEGNGFPSSLSAEQVIHLVYEMNEHDEEEDEWSEGELGDWLRSFSRYELRTLPLASLNLGEHDYDPDLAQQYAGMPGTFPPIVYDAVRRSIMDGNHRAQAAAIRGETTIQAYVGLPPHQAVRK